MDHWGIVKGDIGIRDGRIVKVGKAGNPDTMAGVDPELVVHFRVERRGDEYWAVWGAKANDRAL